MFQDKIFQIMLAISFVVHLFVLLPTSSMTIFSRTKPEEQLIDLMMDEYLKTEVMQIPDMPAAEQQPQAQEPKAAEESISETQKSVEESSAETDLEEYLKKLEEEEKAFNEKLKQVSEEGKKREQEEQMRKAQKRELDIDADTLEKMIFSYTDVLRELIYKNIEFDPAKVEGEEGGYVRVFFTLSKTGELVSATIPPSFRSKSDYLNQIAIEAIKRAAVKFPPFPKDYYKDVETFDIGIRIRFKQISVE